MRRFPLDPRRILDAEPASLVALQALGTVADVVDTLSGLDECGFPADHVRHADAMRKLNEAMAAVEDYADGLRS